MICFGKHYKKINKKMVAFGLAGILLLTNMQSIPYLGQTVQAATDYGLHNPVNTEADGSGTTTWDCVYFGHYLQEDTNGDGKVDENDEKQPIKWRVLSVSGDDAFLLADQGLDCQTYNKTGTEVTWETCTLRSWLNGYDSSNNVDEKDYSSDNFINTAFTMGERNAIQYSWVVNNDNPSYGTEGGNSTADKVYLLSTEEASTAAYGFDSKFTGSSTTREMRATEYAVQRGTGVYTVTGYAGNNSWWLRSPGSDSRDASEVRYDGWGNCYCDVNHSVVAVRPVLHLNLSYSNLWSYAGRVSSDKQENIHDPQVAGDGTVTWDCVYFGNYLQEDTNGDGTVNSSDTKQPIKWRVLSVNGDDAFLMADQNLDCKKYNDTSKDVTWENSTLRSWLNGYGSSCNADMIDYGDDNFINSAFTENEIKSINTTIVVNNDNSTYRTDGGNDTEDKIYLLSIDEAQNIGYGFNKNFSVSSKTRSVTNTAYVNDKSGIGYVNKADTWWLRSPGKYSYWGTFVGRADGYGYEMGFSVTDSNIAVRPVLHLNLSNASFWSYAGTVSATGGTYVDSSAVPCTTSGIVTTQPGIVTTPRMTASPLPTASAEEKDESVTTTCPAVTLQPTETPQPALTPTPVPTEKPDEENHAFLMFADINWKWGNWNTKIAGGNGRDAVITGNGTYTVSINKSDYTDETKVESSAEGTVIFCVDIMGICDTQKFDASKMAISDIIVKCDGKAINTDLSKMYEGDIEGKGNYRLEIRNEYGYGNGDFVTKDEFDIMNPDFTFSDSLSVTFTIKGIKDGKTPAGAFKTADDKSVVAAGGKRAEVADAPEITQRPSEMKTDAPKVTQRPSGMKTDAPTDTQHPLGMKTDVPKDTQHPSDIETEPPRVTQPSDMKINTPVPSLSPTDATVLPEKTVGVIISSPPKTTSGTVTRNKTTASPKKTSTPDGKKWKVSSYKAAAGYTKKSGYLLKKSVKLTWKAVDGVDGYYIYRREGSASVKKLAELSDSSGSSYQDSSVKLGKSYTYRVLPYHISGTGKIDTGTYSSAKTVKIGTTLKKPKISAKVKGSKLTLGFVQAEGEKFETQYRWMNEKKWKKQTKIQGRLKKNINKKINAKGFMLRIRSYAVIDGKKKYSKWSAPVKIR